MHMSLRHLLSPCSESAFLRCFVAKERMFVDTGDSTRGTHLVTWDCLNDLLGAGWLPPDKVLVLLDRKPVPMIMYRSEDRTLNVPALHQLVASGASVVIKHIEDFVPGLGRFADALERLVDQKVQINCYLSFGLSGAFQPHYDTHDVLVIQVYGGKLWRGYGIDIPNPLGGGNTVNPGPLQWQQSVTAGNVLFVPRGEVHDAVTESAPSVHLTCGFIAPNGVRIAEWLATQAQQLPVLRQDLTTAADAETQAAQVASIREGLHRLVDDFEIERFLASFRERAPRGVTLDGPQSWDGGDWLIPTARVATRFAPHRPSVSSGDSLDGRVLETVLASDGLQLIELSRQLEVPLDDVALREAVCRLLRNGSCVLRHFSTSW